MPGPRRMGPKGPDHPTLGVECPLCHEPIDLGQTFTVALLGPGGDPDNQLLARTGQPFQPVGLELHWACVTGQTDDDLPNRPEPSRIILASA